MATRKLPARPPQNERHHYVFLNRDGKPIGLIEAGWTGVDSEDDAWDQFADTRAEERHHRANGVTCRHVDHATYEREIYPLWSAA